MKIKIMGMLAAVAVLLGSLMIGGTMAAFRADTETVNRITVGKLGIELIEQSEDADAVATDKGLQYTEAGMPGDIRSHQVFVKNSEQYDLYVRIGVEKYWTDRDGGKVFAANPALIEVLNNQPENWIEVPDAASAGEKTYYYYKLPLKSGQSTDHVMNQIKISDQITKQVEQAGEVVLDFTKLATQMNITADAVQATSVKSAMKAAWGVTATLDGDTLVSVQ